MSAVNNLMGDVIKKMETGGVNYKAGYKPVRNK